MRGTVARRLRKQAAQETEGKPWINLGVKRISTPVGLIASRAHDPKSGKARYKQLKREYKQ